RSPGWMTRPASPGLRSKSASLTANRSGCPRASSASRTTIPIRRGCVPESRVDGLFRGSLPLDRKECLHRIVHRLEPARVMGRRHGSRARRFERLVAVAEDGVLLVVLPLLELIDGHVDVKLRIVGGFA